MIKMTEKHPAVVGKLDQRAFNAELHERAALLFYEQESWFASPCDTSAKSHSLVTLFEQSLMFSRYVGKHLERYFQRRGLFRCGVISTCSNPDIQIVLVCILRASTHETKHIVSGSFLAEISVSSP